MSHRKLAITLIILLFSFSQASSAQVESREFKRGMATVLLSTLGGAVLGLSTLSFYSQPGDHVSNIPLGALVGLIAGSGYLLYTTSQPKDIPPPSVYEEYSFDLDEKNRRGTLYSQAPLQIQFSFNF